MLHIILEKFRNDGIIEVKQINFDENSKLAKDKCILKGTKRNKNTKIPIINDILIN